MNRSDLVDALSSGLGQITRRDCECAVDAILEAMTRALVQGHRIDIRGFGSFSVGSRAPRVGRNPRSGASVSIPAMRWPHFKAAKALREAVNEPLTHFS